MINIYLFEMLRNLFISIINYFFYYEKKYEVKQIKCEIYVNNKKIIFENRLNDKTITYRNKDQISDNSDNDEDIIFF